jgi:hypothetical protein
MTLYSKCVNRPLVRRRGFRDYDAPLPQRPAASSVSAERRDGRILRWALLGPVGLSRDAAREGNFLAGLGLLTVLVVAFAGAACTTPEASPTRESDVNSGPPPATSDCGSLTVTAAPPDGATLESGKTMTFTQGGTYLVPDGSLRLITSGSGFLRLMFSNNGLTSGNAGFTKDFEGPGTLLVEPNPNQSVTVSLCTP